MAAVSAMQTICFSQVTRVTKLNRGGANQFFSVKYVPAGLTQRYSGLKVRCTPAPSPAPSPSPTPPGSNPPVPSPERDENVLFARFIIRPLAMKLTHSNYLLWYKLVIAAVKGHRLQSHVTVPKAPPSRVIDGSPNPEFADWEQKDQLIVFWIYSSISQEVLSQLADCDTANEIWKSLEGMFKDKDEFNIMQLKYELQRLKKGGLTITEYLSKMKYLIDTLALAGHKLKEDDQVMYYIGGLGQEYDAVIVNVTARIKDIRVKDVRALLLNQEARLNLLNNRGGRFDGGRGS